MIKVQLSSANFEYDIHSLVKAFYPAENVSVGTEDKETTEEVLFRIFVDYLENEIELRLTEDETVIDSSSIQVDDNHRTETKNRLKRALYQMLSNYKKETLPWGTLTGIRPTKIPMSMLEQGKSVEDIISYMKETYFTSEEKIALSIEVAERELELLKDIDYENGYSLYVGIPFCPSTCLYCSFTSYPLGKWKDRMDEYLDTLDKEIDATKELMKGKILNSIYIGGGTPTTLSAEQLRRLITTLQNNFDLSHCVEFTVEAGRPDSITREKLQAISDCGVTRISINPQTMKEETLRIIGRHHTVEQTRECFTLAREMGFDNINMDLILGLPNETMEDVRATLEKIRELKPDNLTVHSLALKRAARLNMFRDEYKNLTFENTWETIDMAAEYARTMGLSPYYLYRQKNMAGNFENVGYAAEGKAGIYNILIMEEVQTIVALGAGTVTKRVFADGRIERCDNVKDVGLYMEKIDEMIGRKKKLFQE